MTLNECATVGYYQMSWLLVIFVYTENSKPWNDDIAVFILRCNLDGIHTITTAFKSGWGVCVCCQLLSVGHNRQHVHILVESGRIGPCTNRSNRHLADFLPTC